MRPYIRSVQYYETDMMGVVHHANYIHWMEEARISVTVSVGSFNGVVLAIRYRMEKEDGTVVFEGRSEHVFLNREGRFVRMKREMPAFCEAIEKTIPKEAGQDE